MENEEYLDIKEGLSVGAVKIANKYELFTEAEVDAINNKIPELDERVGVIEDEIDEINSSLGNMESELIKETKKETNISLSGSNVVIRGIRKVRTNTSFGSDFFFTNSKNNVVMNCDIESGSNGVILGNEGYNETPKNIKVLFNKIKANNGNRARNGKDGEVNGEHDWFMNDIETVNTDVGIESWTGKSRIAFNRIINKTGTGGYGGITLGHKGHQKALFNYVDGFGYGIEVGNSERDQLVLGNTIENCGSGISVSSNGKEKTVNIAYNYIKLKKDGMGISISGADTVNISNCIIEYVSDGDYNNPTESRTGYGIEGKTNCKQLIISNCVFINVSIAIKGGGKFVTVRDCKFYNCTQPYYGNAMNAVFDRCYFENVDYMTAYGMKDGFLKVSNSRINISDDNERRIGQPWYSGRGNSFTSLLISENNTDSGNMLFNPMIPNGSYGDVRARFFLLDGIYYTYNRQSLSEIKTSADDIGLVIKEGMKFFDNYNQRSWEVKENGKHIMRYSGVPNSGVYVKGDKVENTFYKDLSCEGWVCTAGGDFSTDTKPVFKKYGLVES